MSGEFAGYAIDESIDAENDRWLYRQGVMSESTAHDLGIVDHMGRYQHAPTFRSSSKTCRHCGKGGLSWARMEKGWRLCSGGIAHVCDQYNKK